MREFETERLFLRRIREDDAQRMFECWASDPEVPKYMTWKAHESIDDTKRMIDGWLKAYDKPDCFRWGIELKSEKQLIGMIDVVEIVDGEPVIGYCSGKAYWGNGYMTEAFKAVIPEIFDGGYDSIFIEAVDDNIGSNRVILKNGFTLIESKVQKLSDANPITVKLNSYRLCWER